MEENKNNAIVYDVKGLQGRLGIGREAAYSLMRSQGFPSIRIGNKYVVGKDAFVVWMKRNEGKRYTL